MVFANATIDLALAAKLKTTANAVFRSATEIERWLDEQRGAQALRKR
jgi:hypothetical protein